MSIFKLKVGLQILLAMLAVGAYVAVTASAEAGPFFHHRAVGAKGEGEKIEVKTPEEIASSTGAAFVLVRINGMEVVLSVASMQLKGIIYNNALQGQAKITTVFVTPTIVKPELKGCTVVVGQNNTNQVFGHLAWKWNGEKKQLEETSQATQHPVWAFVSSELAEGATELPKGTIISITFKGSGCGIFAGTFALKGDYGAAISPMGLEEWSTSEAQTPSMLKLHFWNGKAFVGAETSEFIGLGELKFKTIGRQGAAAQEIARFAK